MSKIKILFLAANPDRTRRLRLDKEISRISESIRASEYRNRLQLTSAWAVHAADLKLELLRSEPDILHFSGHADQSEIILEREDAEPRAVPQPEEHRERQAFRELGESGEPGAISQQALAELLKIIKDNIRVVVLNACSTGPLAKAIAEFVDFAIGMSQEIDDDAAIAFAASFYGTLGFGRSVQTAFDLGKVELLLAGKRGHNTPVMFVRKGLDAATTVLIGPGAPPVRRVSRERGASQHGSAARLNDIDRSRLEELLAALSPSTFERFVASLDDAAVHLSHDAPVSENVSELLRWADGPTGQGWEAIRNAFQDFWITPPPADLVSKKLAAALRRNYTIQQSLGIGAISQVMRAYDTQLERLVTVKVLTDSKSEQLFDNAVRDVVKVTKHPNIAAVYGASFKSGSHYYIREYIDGVSLRGMLNQKDRPQSITFTHQVFAKVGAAICFVQSRIENDIDIRPEHILIQKISRAMGSSPSQRYNIVVSPDIVQTSTLGRNLDRRGEANLIYWPPELIRKSNFVTRDWANQYRLGIICYEMLIGSERFREITRARSQILVRMLDNDEPAEVPELPAIASLGGHGCPQFLSRAIEKMIRSRQNQRFETLSEAVNSVSHRDYDVEVARDSYRRILIDTASGRAFFEKFYESFLGRCPAAAKAFEDAGFPSSSPLGATGDGEAKREWPRQYMLLKNAIVALLAFKMLGDSGEPNILSGIAEKHVGYPKEYFDAFREALIETVLKCDELSAIGSVREDLRIAWETAIKPGIDFMQGHKK